jgi:hypothetical protein
MQFGITCKWILEYRRHALGLLCLSSQQPELRRPRGHPLASIDRVHCRSHRVFRFCANHWRCHYGAWSGDLPVLDDHCNRRGQAGRTHSKPRGPGVTRPSVLSCVQHGTIRRPSQHILRQSRCPRKPSSPAGPATRSAQSAAKCPEEPHTTRG